MNKINLRNYIDTRYKVATTGPLSMCNNKILNIKENAISKKHVVQKGFNAILCVDEDQTITGPKRFLPKMCLVATEPTLENEAASKRYVDTLMRYNEKIFESSNNGLQLKNNAISSSYIAKNSISKTKLQAQSVINSKLATDSVSTCKLQNEAVTKAKCVTSGKHGVCVLHGDQTVHGARTYVKPISIAEGLNDDHAVTRKKLKDEINKLTARLVLLENEIKQIKK